MKKTSFTGKKSLPIDFSNLTINDLSLVLKIIQKLYAEAEKKDGIIQGDFKKITIPLRLLARVFGISYSFNNVRTEEFEKVISGIQSDIDALLGFDEVFFQEVAETFKEAKKDPQKRKIGLVEKRSGVYAAG